MKRTMPIASVLVAALVGLTACSDGATADESTPVADETTASAEAEPAPVEEESTTPEEQQPTEEAAGTGQSLSDACLSMAGPMAEASAAMSELASVATSEPQAAVDAWTEMVNAFRSVADSVTNDEVKQAVTVVHDDIADVRDGLQLIFVDGDMSAMQEYTVDVEEFQTSYTELMELCTS
ncbi:MAG: hypothetical protein GX596_01710 [Propionibacterium sp.]|nr:hypothetical protein [Propionibacterium sp.]